MMNPHGAPLTKSAFDLLQKLMFLQTHARMMQSHDSMISRQIIQFFQAIILFSMDISGMCCTRYDHIT